MPKSKLADPRQTLVFKIEPPPDMSAKEWELIKRRAQEAVKKIVWDAGYQTGRLKGDVSDGAPRPAIGRRSLSSHA